MERYLVTLSLGPVQSMIGAARRTRDLWCGSWLLSEAARAAARVLHQKHANCLIFPHVKDADMELAPQNGPTDGANMSNILRADIQSADVRTLCNEAKEAASARLRELGKQARLRMPHSCPVRKEVWDAQIGEVLECYAAWVAFPDDSYADASRKLGATLAARKATRDFRQCRPLATQGLPKSSLDGALETVLPKGLNASERRRIGLSDNEQLDALGVMKRLAGSVDQFTPYSRIAADPWIEEKLTEDQQRRLREAYEPLVALDQATRVKGNAGIYSALPFDGQMLYPSRLEAELSKADGQDRQAAAEALKQCLRQIRHEGAVGAPVPYAAILKADGDQMGKLLSRAKTVDQSRAISQALHGFASQVRDIVRDHRGHAIYAGGDDVLALVPLIQALECARKLADTFKSSLAKIADELAVDCPTLSVGLGIGHFMQPLGALRDRAERAEMLAKGDGSERPRNALAIALGVRSGGEHRLRIRWDDEAALEDMERATGAFRDKEIPSRAAYDLRGIDLRLAWLRNDDSPQAKGMREAEVRRLLSRARAPGGKREVSSDVRDLVLRRVEAEPLDKVADMLVIARWLAARTAADVGE